MKPQKLTLTQAEDKLANMLDKQFPKGKCQERGQAIVLYAEAVILMRRLVEENLK